MPYKIRNISGFTLIEMMIVISIIIFLASLSFFPYAYYMKRSYVERSIDTLGQEWLLAHKDVRNGKLFSPDKHANIVLVFEKGVLGISEYLLSGSTLPPISDFNSVPINTDIKFERFFSFDSDIRILGFRGIPDAPNISKLGYLISAPSGSGVFFTGSSIPFSLTGIFLTIGYNGANLETGHAREVLLRPYLQ